MSVETAQPIGLPVKRRIGAAAGDVMQHLSSPKRQFMWPDSSVSSSAVLVKLLNSAQQALAGDHEEARQFIARAADLLKGDVERRDAIEHPETAEPANRHLAPWQTRRAKEFIEANLAETIRIEDLADVTRLSASYFSRAFRSDIGESPYAYVIRQRIERAKEMMLRTDQSLAYIARACGLSDQPHLTRLFRRIVGVSPASWRRLQRSAT